MNLKMCFTAVGLDSLCQDKLKIFMTSNKEDLNWKLFRIQGQTVLFKQDFLFYKLVAYGLRGIKPTT